MSYTISKLDAGGIISNYDCSIQCVHCAHNSSTLRKKGFISEKMAAKILSKLESVGCKSLHIEGGEPFLYVDDLIRLVKQINDSSIKLEYIATNCSWYKNKNNTKKILSSLKEQGLCRLFLKVSPFQNEHIPLKKVQNVANIATQLGMSVILWNNDVYSDVNSFDPSKTHSLQQYINKYGDDYINKLAECFNVSFIGRRYEPYDKNLNKYSISEILTQNQGCDKDFPTNNHFHVDLYGNFIFSHTNGVTCSIDDINKKLDSKKYPYLSILTNGGIESMYKLAVKKYDFKPKKDGYISKCHLCFDIRQYLVNTRDVNSPDLQPPEFYKKLTDI
jgi:organic radical activating enzyme